MNCKATAEPRTGGMASLVLGVPWDEARNCSLGLLTVWVSFHLFAALNSQCMSAKMQARGGNGRTSAAQAA